MISNKLINKIENAVFDIVCRFGLLSIGIQCKKKTISLFFVLNQILNLFVYNELVYKYN